MPLSFRAGRRGRTGERVAAAANEGSVALRALRLVLPLLLLLVLALGHAASAHPAGDQHQSHPVATASHHAEAAATDCCGVLAGDEDSRACLAQCLASCGYCAPLPLPTAFPERATASPFPAASGARDGAIASPHPRPPSFS